MRHLAWMLVFLTVIGCGGGSNHRPTAESSLTDESSVPADVASLFEKGEVARAIELLSARIAKSPQDTSLLSLRATAYHQIGKHKDALADLDQAIALNKSDAKLYNNRGFMLLGMEQFDAAISDFNKSSELSPKYKNAFNNRGLLYIAKKQYDDAIAEFNKALQIDDRYVDAYNNRGFAEFESGQIESALDDFNIAIQLSPEYVNAYNNRGLLRARAGDYENAIIDFTQAMMLDPLNPKYYEHRLEVYELQGAADKALADERKIDWLIEYHQLTRQIALSSFPEDELTDRARHFLQTNDLEGALKDLNRAISLKSDHPQALLTRAEVHFKQKSFDKAMSDAEASLLIDPTQGAYSILGDLYLNRGNYDKAIEHFAHARRVDPSVAEAYYAQSKSLESQGKAELAKGSLQQALLLDPDIESRMR